MTEYTFDSAVVCTQYADLLDLIRDELKALKVETVINPEGTTRAVEELVMRPDALLVLDWNYGASRVMEVLESVRSPLRLDVRPIFLFSIDDVKGLDGLAAEYGVAAIHTGEITPEIMAEHLEQVRRAEALPPAVREALVRVVDVRKRGDWTAARTLLEKARADFPDVERINVELAENMFFQNDPRAALTLLEPLGADEHASPRVLNLIGRCQLKLGQYQEATQTLQRAKLINPFNLERLLNLGNAYLEMDVPAEAKDQFAEALEIDPMNMNAIEGMGKSLLLGNEINEALVFMKQLSSHREMASVFNAAAVLSIRSGRFAAGLGLYKVALKTIGGDLQVAAKLAFNMGIAFYRHGDKQTAHFCFSASTELDPQNLKARRNAHVLSREFGRATMPSRDVIIHDLIELLDDKAQTVSENQVGLDDYEEEIEAG